MNPLKMTGLNMLIGASIVTWGLSKAITKIKGVPIHVSASENGRLIAEYISLVEQSGRISWEVAKFRFNHRQNDTLSKMISATHSSGVFAITEKKPNKNKDIIVRSLGK